MDFGVYRTIRLLGSGGMSEVYEVENALNGSRHALKYFTYSGEVDTVRERFEAEGRLLLRLNHPRIVKVTDVGTEVESGRPYLVMDLVLDVVGEVRSLADVREGEATEETIGRWYDDIREGLAYIHGKGIVHRDLKLQNIMIGVDGHAVIADFGISKIVGQDGEEGTVVDPVQTIIRLRSGRNPLMGSIGYMAPELEMGMPASPQSDWFALGVIVYKLLTGMWCDARTDVVGTLDTYDPVWTRIIPKLLHANPQGRECPSYAEEKAKDREALEFELDERCFKEKAKTRQVRRVACCAGIVALLSGMGFAWTGYELHVQHKAWQLKLTETGLSHRVPGFDELFRIPAEAKGAERHDADGNVTMYSRSQFEAARVDALVLGHRILSALETGGITPEHAIEELGKIYRQLDDDSPSSPFDNLRFGGLDYIQFGATGPLRMLFGQAIEKLANAVEQ